MTPTPCPNCARLATERDAALADLRLLQHDTLKAWRKSRERMVGRKDCAACGHRHLRDGACLDCPCGARA